MKVQPGMQREKVRDCKTGEHYVRGLELWLYQTGASVYMLRIGKPARYVRIGDASDITCEEARAAARKAKHEHDTGTKIEIERKPSVAVVIGKFRRGYRTTKGKGRSIEKHPAWTANLARLERAVSGRALESITTSTLQEIKNRDGLGVQAVAAPAVSYDGANAHGADGGRWT